MQPILRTSRLSLRPAMASDAEALFELDSDPEVMRYLTGGSGTPMEEIASRILPRFLRYPARAPWAGVWLAFDTTGEFVGWFSLRPPDDEGGGADLGYRLRRAAWGQGLATEGARCLVEFAFARGAQRVFATTYEHNAGSRRVLEKLGMRHVRSYRPSAEELTEHATFAVGGAEPWDGDEVEYEVTSSEWASARKGA